MTTPLDFTDIAGEKTAKAKLGILKARQAMQQKTLKSQQAELAKLNAKKTKSKKDLQSIAALKARIGKTSATLKTISSATVTAQNKYYEVTGQYEQLLEGSNRDAYMALSSLFDQYGLGTLADKIYDYVKNGYGSDTISILLQDTPEYKKRFAGNEARLKAGMSVLSPAEYISTENSYRQIMKQSGLPIGFYDSTDDFTDFISKDMSPTELQGRVDLATQATALANPAYKQALEQMGLGQGEIAAYFLDQAKALPFLQKAAATASIGAEALQRGFAFDQQYTENLATQGISREQAATAYAQIGDEFSDLKTLGSIYGGGWTQRQAEESAFTGGTEASKQRSGLISKEKSAFSGATGGAKSGLAQSGGAR
jgi:hypothetical protein